LDTLKLVGTVDIESWCLPCQEPHREYECPRKDEDYPGDIKFMICNINDEQVTQEKINESKRIGEREGRICALNKLTGDQKKELRRREILTYKRKMLHPLCHNPILLFHQQKRWLHHLHHWYVSFFLRQLLYMTFS
jgi:hypothetical protein